MEKKKSFSLVKMNPNISVSANLYVLCVLRIYAMFHFFMKSLYFESPCFI